MSIVEINKKKFKVENHEFVRLPTISKYCNLIIRKNVGYYERVISLLNELKNINSDIVDTIIFVSPTHGGFMPLECSKKFKNIYIYNCNEKHKNNIIENMELLDTHYDIKDKNKIFIKNLMDIPIQEKNKKNIIIVNENVSSKSINDVMTFLSLFNCIFLTVDDVIVDELLDHSLYKLENTNLNLYIPFSNTFLFEKEFKYFFLDNDIKKTNILKYDNLINFCVMVKNGGEEFKKMLLENIHLIDRWTILDTGSTDNTLDIINEVLVGKKKGVLYQEPFIDFGKSRNRCIELAGDDCKFFLMLDDTYVVKNKGKEFVNFVRDDQYADSFSFYIKSDDVEYTSNRLVKTDRKNLRYLFKIHEVLNPKNNVNVIIPIDDAHIQDNRSDYMQDRTMSRKELDLKLLFEEVRDDPDNPRHYYYIAQTYNVISKHELAFEYFLKRYHHKDPRKEGFVQEKHDAIFEAARIANFKINKSWEECKQYYEWAYETDSERPESQYFLGIHYYLMGDYENKRIAFEYFKKAFKIGYPLDKQYSLKPTLSFYFLPKFLTELCFDFEECNLGKQVCEYYFINNKTPTDIHDTMSSWYKIFEKLCLLINLKEDTFSNNKVLTVNYSPQNVLHKPILCFVADGGWDKWAGSDILTKGVGGSETYIIEMARYIQKIGLFNVFVFCNCGEKEEVFENVIYLDLTKYYSFIKNNNIHSCLISRYTEYIPVTCKGNVDNIYIVFHDLLMNGMVVPNNYKIKKFLCLTEWHVGHFNEIFPQFKHLSYPLYYGVDMNKFKIKETVSKIPYKFIYSSFPNRGLLQLLELWPIIINSFPSASLHIYSDVNGKWVNNIAPDDMKECKRLLELYKNFNINYCGWVDKKTLAESWLTADVWFYPCTFTETFCLTALEAAITKTLVVTNHLGALQNTVGDRGVIIQGDPRTNEWKNNAIFELFTILDLKNKDKKIDLIEKNYKWATNLSWENQSVVLQKHFTENMNMNVFINNDNNKDKNKNTENITIRIKEENSNNFIEKQQNDIVKYSTTITKKYNNIPIDELNYAGMLNWVHDLPKNDLNELDIFIKNLDYFNNKGIINPKILEIGTFVGTSLIHILKHIPNSYGIGIDRWESYHEDFIYSSNDIRNNEVVKNIEKNNIRKIFYDNIKIANLTERMEGVKGDSTEILLQMVINGDMFDLIYVDASHLGFDCYGDMLIAFQILNKNGLLIIDDVSFNKSSDNGESKLEVKQFTDTPYYSVIHFYEKYKSRLRILNSSYRLFLEKIN